MTTVTPSYFRHHIENHFDDLDLDLVVRKRKRGYAIYWRDDHEPLARLRPTGRGDEVEVEYWEEDRWVPVEEFGLALPLEEALEYVSDDPKGIFFGRDDHDLDDGDDEGLEPAAYAKAKKSARLTYAHLLVCSMLGAAIGGLFSDLLWGIAASAAAAFLACATTVGISLRLRSISVLVVLAATSALLACVGGITGCAVHAGLGSGVWAALGGLASGTICNWLLFRRGVLTWVVGLLAGLNLAAYLAELWGIGDRYTGLVLVALLAAGGASICRGLMDFFQLSAVSSQFSADSGRHS